MGRLKDAVMSIMDAHEEETGEAMSFEEAAAIMQARLDRSLDAERQANCKHKDRDGHACLDCGKDMAEDDACAAEARRDAAEDR